MSAYIVGNDMIDLIVSACLYKKGRDSDPFRVFTEDGWQAWFDTQQDGDALAHLLREANWDSVNYRYQDSATPWDSETPFRKVHHIGGERGALIPWGHVLLALDCYEYQSCEHPGYSDSLACQVIDTVRRQVCKHVARGIDAPWEWSREGLEKREREHRDRIMEQLRA